MIILGASITKKTLFPFGCKLFFTNRKIVLDNGKFLLAYGNQIKVKERQAYASTDSHSVSRTWPS